jgi:vancomycin resistance protein YoaR
MDSINNNAQIGDSTGRSKVSKPVIFGAGGLVLFILLLAGFLFYNSSLEAKYTGKIEPGVKISSLNVGEMTRDEAKTAVLKQMDAYIQKPFVLTFQDSTWKPTLEQLGVRLNLEGTLDKAAQLGKGGDFLGGLRVFKMMSPLDQNLPIEVEIDEAKLKGYLSDISSRIKRDTVEPTVAFDKDGKLVTTEGKEGFNVDYDATYAAIRKSLETLTASDENFLKVRNVPTIVSEEEVAEFKKEVEPYVSQPVTLAFKEKTWVFDRKTLAEQIKIQRDLDPNAAKNLAFTFEKAYFEKFVEKLAAEVNQKPKNAEFTWNGKLSFTKPSQDGLTLNVARTMDNLNQAFTAAETDKRKAWLWVDTTEAEISSDKPEKIGKFELMGQGVSQFSGSVGARVTNITVGAKWLNQTLVAPKSNFSFLRAIGGITEEKGFVEGLAILTEGTAPEIGGGICQVSTTVFRAAFFAGLPIVERNAHIYRVGWYEEMNEPVGFDAAIYEPGLDFKFYNPTDYWMAVESYVKNGRLYVNIYGNKTQGQTVELVSSGIANVTNPPPDKTEIDPKLAPGQRKQVDTARKGLTTTLTRIIKVDGKEVKRDNFPTRFQAWPNIYKVGPTPTPKPETPKPTEAPKTEAPKPGTEAPKTEAPKTEAPKTQAPKPTEPAKTEAPKPTEPAKTEAPNPISTPKP